MPAEEKLRPDTGTKLLAEAKVRSWKTLTTTVPQSAVQPNVWPVGRQPDCRATPAGTSGGVERDFGLAYIVPRCVAVIERNAWHPGLAALKPAPVVDGRATGKDSSRMRELRSR